MSVCGAISSRQLTVVYSFYSVYSESKIRLDTLVLTLVLFTLKQKFLKYCIALILHCSNKVQIYLYIFLRNTYTKCADDYANISLFIFSCIVLVPGACNCVPSVNIVWDLDWNTPVPKISVTCVVVE